MEESAAAPSASPAPAAPATPPVPVVNPFPADGPHAETAKKIKDNLKKVYDPEIPMNIVDLGLIYSIDWTGDDVTVHMTLTSPGCPVAGILAEEVKAAAEKDTGVKNATVDMIWEPAWSPERMSDFAKRQFGYM
ncbi:MAG: iron-sulfur cluster assembly protein [Thermoplasmata archaeon]|nr:iron-sulfur cluster assembly protein [Thermoplasmata archaeon]